MRTPIIALALSALVAIPVAATAASSLRSIMHGWKADARSMQAMLSGRSAFNDGAIRHMLQTYAAEAGSVAARVHGTTASAQDFKRRFVAFQGQAQTALGDMGRPPALKADFVRLTKDCQSCHDKFNN